MNSMDEAGGSPDVEKYAARRAAQQEQSQQMQSQQQMSDLPVSERIDEIKHVACC